VVSPLKESVMLTQLSQASEIPSRIRAEYGEMPGLALTSAQAERLWALDLDSLLTLLVSKGFLAFVRRERSSMA